jgi:methyltransferase (TIGR00027 family)
MDPVGFTSRLTAAARARETERPDRLFDDPYAAKLAGPEGFSFLDQHWGAFGATWPSFEVRTRYFDDYLLDATLKRNVRQVVIAAAGLDTRAFRLPWPQDVTVFELDQAEVLAYKASILDQTGAKPRCARKLISVDLRDDWRPLLLAAGYRPEAPSVWLVEGLAMYLPEAANVRLFTEIAEISSMESHLALDIIPSVIFNMTNFTDLYVSRGHPVKYATDDPLPLLRQCGWDAQSRNPMDVADDLGRPFPAYIPRMPTQSGFLIAERVAAS